jgi:hypothetical protein
MEGANYFSRKSGKNFLSRKEGEGFALSSNHSIHPIITITVQTKLDRVPRTKA